MASLVLEVHGKRHTIKSTPMQSLNALIREALKLSKLEDVSPEACKLFHNKKEIKDLSTPVRYAGLSAMAKLEVVTGREPRLGVQDASLPPAVAPSAPAATAVCTQTSTAAPAIAAAAPTPQPAETQPAAAVPVATPAHTLGVSSSSGRGPATEQQSVVQEPQQPPPQQHPSVAVFGQEVHVFTREAELAVESSHMAIDDREPPDEFYEVTEGDVQRAMAGLVRARAEAEGGTHLMTKQMRANEEARRAAGYGPVTVRVSLPDGHVLQATFQASQPLSKLRGVVRRAVVEGLADRLYLYITPPKTVLKDMDASFYQAKLIPAARVHVGIQGQAEQPEGATLLRPEVLQLLAPPPDKASALHHRDPAAGAPVGAGGDKRRNGEGASGEGPGPSGTAGGSGGAGPGRLGGGGGAAGGAKVPKWLKLGGK